MAHFKAVLVGGPVEIEQKDRVQRAVSLSDAIKFPRYGGYEHFRHFGEFVSIEGEQAAVFTWTRRTAIAE